MKVTFNHSAVTQIVLAFALATFVNIQQTAMAGIGSGEGASSPSASEALRGALDNVRHRYNQTLDYYGLTELYYGETRGVCALKLDKPGRAEPLSILYVRSDNTIEYSQVIPKGLAQQLINDRMLIDSYQKVRRSEDAAMNRLTSEQVKEWHEFRNANAHLGLAHAISKFSMQHNVSKNKLRNLIGEEKDLKDMTDEEQTEYMKGDMYKALKEKEQREREMRREKLERENEESERQIRKERIERQKAERRAKWTKIANTASSDDIRIAMRDKGDADYFLELRRKKKQGNTLDEKEQESWDKFVDRISHNGHFRKLENEKYKKTQTRSRNTLDKSSDWQQRKMSRPTSKSVPRSGKGLTISGSRSGKLTLTGQ
jgi:hypothetical protein